MKKYIMYFIFIFILFFLIPAILVNKRNISVLAKTDNVIEIENQEEYQYKTYETIKLLHKDTNVVEEIKLDEYIKNVVSAEMPAKYELEALKAQAIVARTYTIYKIEKSQKHKEADICDQSDCCQAWISKEDRLKKWDGDKRDEYWNKIETAVKETAGKIVTYHNQPINAFFHSNSGGKTQIPLYVWGGEGYPYLQVVETAGEENYSQYQSEAQFTKDELIHKIQEKHPNFEINFNDEDCIKIIKRDESNRVSTVKMGNLELSGVETRTLLGLRSANFEVEILDENIKFSVIGYGHGVGMSQTGADAMAKQGSSCEDIIKHFYKDVEIKNL